MTGSCQLSEEVFTGRPTASPYRSTLHPRRSNDCSTSASSRRHDLRADLDRGWGGPQAAHYFDRLVYRLPRFPSLQADPAPRMGLAVSLLRVLSTGLCTGVRSFGTAPKCGSVATISYRGPASNRMQRRTGGDKPYPPVAPMPTPRAALEVGSGHGVALAGQKRHLEGTLGVDCQRRRISYDNFFRRSGRKDDHYSHAPNRSARAPWDTQ